MTNLFKSWPFLFYKFMEEFHLAISMIIKILWLLGFHIFPQAT